ncbi:MAG: ferritin-like domain-containing protein [Firmicutes bacterium]|nr:ferritin-like domain-containing protein [Bacillota bacterium]MCL5038235.1 ferritin-like domain-containing protein [Bacillota bacterium]
MVQSLTQREVLELSDCLAAETVVVEKLGFYASQVTNPELRRTFQDIQSIHLRHYDMLVREMEMSAQSQPFTGAGQFYSPNPPLGAAQYGGAAQWTSQFAGQPTYATPQYTGGAGQYRGETGTQRRQ